jgi:P-type E1-E2 ATPase
VFDETVFERLRDVDVVVFDKTGTLTTGEMEVVESDAPSDLLAAAAQLERRAAHPAANAIAAAFARGADADPARPDGGVVDESEEGGERERRVREFTSHPTGVEGVIDGTDVLVGNLDLFTRHGWTVSDDIRDRVADARGFGRLPVVVGRDGVAAGIVVVGDEPREGWDETLTRLGRRGAEVVVLTGDDEDATDFFSGHASVTHVFAGISPEGKTATIRRLGSEGRVAMVGDGTNDAPALAAADLGISLGGGTALAADAADLAIADDRISSVETAFDIASAAHRRGRQNNGLALVYNGIVLSTLAAGIFNPVTVMAAVATSGGLVLANATRDLIDDPET